MELFIDNIDLTGIKLPNSIRVGADYDVDILYTLNGTPVNITGLTLDIKVIDNDLTVIKTINFTITDAPNGLGNLSADFTGAPVGLYKWQGRQIFNGIDKDLFYGPFEIEENLL